MAITPGDLARVRQEKLARDAMSVDERNAELTDAVSHVFATHSLTWGDDLSEEMMSALRGHVQGGASNAESAGGGIHGATVPGAEPPARATVDGSEESLMDDTAIAERITQEADALEAAHDILHQALED